MGTCVRIALVIVGCTRAALRRRDAIVVLYVGSASEARSESAAYTIEKKMPFYHCESWRQNKLPTYADAGPLEYKSNPSRQV